MKNIIKALIEFQKQIGTIKKDKVNPFFNSFYTDLAGFIDATRQIMIDCGLAIAQTTKFQDGITLLITTLWHESGESITSEYPLLPIKNDPQSYGSCLTYARRYAYQAILNIASDDDDANKASQSNGNGKSNHQSVLETKFKCPHCNSMSGMKSKYGSGFYCLNCKAKWGGEPEPPLKPINIEQLYNDLYDNTLKGIDIAGKDPVLDRMLSELDEAMSLKDERKAQAMVSNVKKHLQNNKNLLH